MKKILCIALILILAFGMVACGEEEPDGVVEIEDFGYCMSKVEDYFIYYGVKVKNTSTNLAVSGVTVAISAISEDGTVLNSVEAYLCQIAPGETVVYSDSALDASEKPAKVTAEIKEGEETWIDPATMDFGDYEKLETVDSKKTKESFTGVVVNNNESAIDRVHVFIIFKNADGGITGGDIAYVDNIPANGKAKYEVPILGDYTTDNYEVYAYPYY